MTPVLEVAKPVIMTGASIPAIIAGVKRRTRRMPTGQWERIRPGDRLWVREAFRTWTYTCSFMSGGEDHFGPCDEDCHQVYVAYRATPRDGYRPIPDGKRIVYLDESTPIESNKNLLGPWKPSLHMPRWASRITLEVTGVRRELLQDITEEDAIAEGVDFWPDLGSDEVDTTPARGQFFKLWDKLHGAGAAATNPLVVVTSFKRI